MTNKVIIISYILLNDCFNSIDKFSSEFKNRKTNEFYRELDMEDKT